MQMNRQRFNSGYSLFDRKAAMTGLSDEDDGFKFESKKEMKFSS